MLINLLTERYPGMRFWLLQRMTAIFMAIYVPLFIVLFMGSSPNVYQEWVDFNSPWWWRSLSGFFFLSLCIHAWIGVRDVLRDYVFNQMLRAYLQAMVELVLMACLVWSIVIIWSI